MQEKQRPNFDPNSGSNNSNKSKVTVKKPDVDALINRAKQAVQDSKNGEKKKVQSTSRISYGDRCGC